MKIRLSIIDKNSVSTRFYMYIDGVSCCNSDIFMTNERFDEFVDRLKPDEVLE